ERGPYHVSNQGWIDRAGSLGDSESADFDSDRKLELALVQPGRLSESLAVSNEGIDAVRFRQNRIIQDRYARQARVDTRRPLYEPFLHGEYGRDDPLGEGGTPPDDKVRPDWYYFAAPSTLGNLAMEPGGIRSSLAETQAG